MWEEELISYAERQLVWAAFDKYLTVVFISTVRSSPLPSLTWHYMSSQSVKPSNKCQIKIEIFTQISKNIFFLEENGNNCFKWAVNICFRKRHPATVQTPGRQLVEAELMEPLVTYLDRLEPSWATSNHNNSQGRDFNDNFRCDADAGKGFETQFVMEFSHMRLGSHRSDQAPVSCRDSKTLIFSDLEPLMKVPRHKTWKIVVYCLPNWSSSSVLLLSTKDKVAVGIIKKNLSKIFVRVFCKISVTFCCLFSILVLPMLELYQIFPLNIVWILLLMLEFLIYFLFFI